MLLKKIKNFFFFLIIFNLNKIRYFLEIVKINSDSFNSYYDSLSYYFLGSNHPRRYQAYLKRFRSVEFWLKKNSTWQQKNKDKSLNFFYFKQTIIFSHFFVSISLISFLNFYKYKIDPIFRSPRTPFIC